MRVRFPKVSEKSVLYWFPFDKVKKGQTVVIYGAGLYGLVIAKQIETTKLVSVKYFCDKNYKDIKLKDYKVYSKKKLLKDDFDYVFIGSKAHENEIKNELIELGVSGEKLLALEFDNYEFIYKYIPEYNDIMYDKIIKIIEKKKYDEVFFYLSWAKFLNEEQKNKIIDEILKLKQSNELLDKLLYYRYTDMLGLFSKSVFKNWVQDVLKDVDNPKIWGRILVEMCGTEWYNSNYVYKKYYLDRREIAKKYACYLKTTYDLYPLEKTKNNKKVKMAVIAYELELSNVAHGPSQNVLNVCNEMSRLDYDITVFVEDNSKDSMKNRHMHIYDGDVELSYLHKKRNKKKFPDNVKIVYSEKKDWEKRIVEQARNIYEFQPDIIFSLGGEATIIPFIFKNEIVVVNSFLTGFRSAIEADVHLCTSKQLAIEACKDFDGIDMDKYVEIPRGLILKDNNKPKKRKFYKLQEDQFVMVTVGYSLECFLPKKFLMPIGKMLKRNPNFVWICIGTPKIRQIEAFFPELIKNKQIRMISCDYNLPSLYEVADVYLNPPRKGGGTGLAQAMYSGLPIAMNFFPSSDGVMWLGKENVIPGDVEDLVTYIEALSNDPTYKQTESDRMRKEAENFSYHNVISKIDNIFRELV